MMDFLLSIPLISAFFTPSWSTYGNIFFFWTVWSSLVFTHDAPTIHACALLAIRVVLWLAPTLIFLAFDTLLPSLAPSIKFAGTASLPRRPLHLLGVSLLNMLFVTGFEAALSYGFDYATGSPLFRTTSTLPFPWQTFKHVIILFTAREILMYYTHRFLLHDSSRSPTLTRLHTRWGHGEPCSSLQIYADHPLPLLTLHLTPVLLVPSLVLRPHLLTYLLFTALCTLQSTLTNSGYNVGLGILLGGIARRTAVHYASGGSANYGAWGVLDWIHGTSKGGDVLADVRDEADKHDVKERSAKKVGDGANVLQDGVDSLTDGVAKKKGGRKRT